MRTQDAFGILLDQFDTIINGYPAPEKVKVPLTELKNKSFLDVNLTFHQRDAIRARCNNYILNQYGDQRKGNDTRSDYQKKLN